MWFGLLAVPALLASVGVAACGGDDDGGTSQTAETQPATTAAATTAATGATGVSTPAASPPASASGTVAASQIPAGAPEVDQDNLAFKPNKLTVKAGEKVYMKNSESALHTVNVNGKNLSGNMKKGQVFVWTAGAAGSYKITCDYHPQMNATITVQ